MAKMHPCSGHFARKANYYVSVMNIMKQKLQSTGFPDEYIYAQIVRSYSLAANAWKGCTCDPDYWAYRAEESLWRHVQDSVPDAGPFPGKQCELFVQCHKKTNLMGWDSGDDGNTPAGSLRSTVASSSRSSEDGEESGSPYIKSEYSSQGVVEKEDDRGFSTYKKADVQTRGARIKLEYSSPEAFGQDPCHVICNTTRTCWTFVSSPQTNKKIPKLQPRSTHEGRSPHHEGADPYESQYQETVQSGLEMENRVQRGYEPLYRYINDHGDYRGGIEPIHHDNNEHKDGGEEGKDLYIQWGNEEGGYQGHNETYDY